MSDPTPATGDSSRKRLALDSSAVVAWILQNAGRWQAIQQLIDSPDVELVLPGPVLTESVYVAREQGNTSSPQAILATLLAQHMSIEHSTTEDLLRAAELHEASLANPYVRRNGAPGTLSLGDCLILATTERLDIPIATYDIGWAAEETSRITSVQVINLWGPAKAS